MLDQLGPQARLGDSAVPRHNLQVLVDIAAAALARAREAWGPNAPDA